MSRRPHVRKPVRVLRWNPATVISCLALILSATAFLWSFLTNAEMWASSAIRELIAEEARLSREHDAPGAAALYIADAYVRDMNSPDPAARWNGAGAIEDRYRGLPQFEKLVHMNVRIHRINLLTGLAEATSSTDGVIITREFGRDERRTIANNGKDTWDFQRVNRTWFLPWTGKWKISSLTY